jgi:hypothetical protein
MVSKGRRWPEELDGLLLRAALLDGDEAVDAWRSWRERGGEVEGLEKEPFRLLPLIYRNLSRIGADEPDLPSLKAAYRFCWGTSQRLIERAAGALEALEAAGLETIVAKGAALALLHYRDVGARPMGDVDILIRTRCAEQALSVLRDAGWSPVETGAERMVRVQHATPMRSPDGAEIDLHWRLLDQPARDDDVWEAAMPVEIGRASTLALCPTDQLLHVCVHGLAIAPPPLRWVADAVTVIRTADPEIDWDRLVERARARRVTIPLTAALEHLSDEFAVEVPEPALSQLRDTPTATRDRLAHRVAMNPPPRGRRYVAAWVRYRRLRTVPHDSPIPSGFVDFMADLWGLAGRRAPRG